MSKRARYVGPHDEVIVENSEHGFRDVVKRNGLLSADAPAAVRDELLANQADWSAQADPSTAKAEKE